MTEKVIQLLKTHDFTIPQLLFFKYQELNMTLEELHFIIYLMNTKDLAFNPKKFSSDLGTSMPEVLELVNNLVNKDLLSLDLRKEGNIRNEYLNLDKLYNKLSFLVINE